jgi:hypothetical protein
MLNTRVIILVLAAGVIAFAADDAWKNKPVPEWTADDAHQIMTDSPWAKTVTPTMEFSSSDGQRRSRGGGGRGGGIGIGGIGIGIPGIGGTGRRGGGGYPGGGYPGGGNPGGNYPDGGGRTESVSPPTLTLRWESALPVREAELKARDVDAPTLDENHYAIAVIGVPREMLKADSRAMEGELKKQVTLKRDGKKDLKPSSVEIHQREDGPIILFLFPKSAEISKTDRHAEFDAQIGRLKFSDTFDMEDMVYLGRLEL